MVFCSYPITPASALLHHLAKLRGHGVTTFQAEDEIAAACAAIGASYAGSLGVTASSGPGIALKTEAIGLAVATELPLVIVNAQRGGPSTGMPTKTEQSDLYQAVMGRNGDTPIVVLAAATPSDCFAMAREAVRIAVHHMTPVMLLTDGFLANSSEPWLIPDVDATPAFPARFRTDPEGFHPFLRDERLVRPWVKPGTPGLEHRIGGIEKDHDSGNISYDPANHQRMTDARWNKVLKVADDLPEQACEQGAPGADLAIVGWGSTYGPIARAVMDARERGLNVAHIHLRHVWPLPRNLGQLLRSFPRILVPEMNQGQLVTLLRSEYLVPAKGLSKVTGRPFTVAELDAAIAAALEAEPMNAHATLRQPKDYATDQEVRWCPGCGDYAILKAVLKTLSDLQADPAQTVFVSGIGCAARFPYYVETYGFHTIHGRAPAVATGVKLANPDLDVWVVGGDGDLLSIGGNHLIHALRRNLDLQILLFNNEIYGLTKGQASPTSRRGTRSPSTPQGSLDAPLSALKLALGAGARFVARGIDTQQKLLPEILKRARSHKGAALVEILQNCIVYNDGVFDPITAKAGEADAQLHLAHGEPLLFGKERDKGLRLRADGFGLEIVPAGTDGILRHDETNPQLAACWRRSSRPCRWRSA